MYNKVCEFWSYFNDNRNSINRAGFFNLDDIIQQLHNILKSIHSSLCFECGFPEGQNKQFFLSADGISDAFIALDCVYHYKREIEGWDIMKYRQPINQLEELVMCLDPQDSTSKVTFSDILFTLKEHESGGGVINFFIPGYQRDNQHHELSRWVILDQCIGEYSAVKRIVLYNTFSIDQAPQEARSVLNLRSELNVLKLKYIQDFWSFFSENHKDCFDQSTFYNQLQDKLSLINQDLSFVIFENDGDNKSGLELTSKGVEEAFEDIELLYQYKPEIEEWNLYKYRAPYQDFIDDDIADVLFSVLDLNNDKHTIMFFMPELSENLSEEQFYEYRKLAWAILRGTIGEYNATKKFLYQCFPLEGTPHQTFQFSGSEIKSVLYLEHELAKIGN